MEEAVAEHLRKEDLHAALGQQLHVDAVLLQRRHVGDGNAVDALHHQHGFATVVGIDLRHVQHRAIFKVTAQLNGVGRFAQQIQLVDQRFLVVAHHLHGTQTAPVRQQARHPARQAIDELHIRFDHRQDVRADHLDHHLLAGGFQGGGMHLRDRRRRQRFDIEIIEPGFYRTADRFFNLLFSLYAVEGRDAILQNGELVGDHGREKVATRREHLAELDPDRTELLHRQAHTHADLFIFMAVRQPKNRAAPEAQRNGKAHAGYQFIKTVSQKNPDDEI